MTQVIEENEAENAEEDGNRIINVVLAIIVVKVDTSSNYAD